MAKRVRKELEQVLNDNDITGIQIKPVGSSFMHFEASVQGPADSPFQGGTFLLDIKIPASYPFEPPKVHFITKVWHPNVSSQTGAICLDILKSAWSPALTLKTMLLSIVALLTAAEPKDPQDAQVAKQYLTNRALYNKTAAYWTKTYATAAQAQQKKVTPEMAKLMEMGFSSEQSKRALDECAGDVEAAVLKLLG
mmetsp:Transcript_9160/g.13294  ORF Transcript_9160/g.13294 Transcript_9160/m.13294 type:complete len:195 (-) Transcript_9160:4-588(-)